MINWRYLFKFLFLCTAFTWPANADDVDTLAITGDANAQYELGRRLERGEGVQQNDEQALYWFKQAAEKGHGVAQFNLGWMYANGYGGPRDNVQAYFWFSQAATQQVEDAVGQLAAISREMSAGDLAQARSLLGQDIQADQTVNTLNLSKDATEAFAELRLRYNHGDSSNALPSLSEMALSGYSDAQNLLGFHLMNADSEVGRQEAFKWLLTAAKQGNAAARYNLAVCYLKAIGTSSEPTKALRWLVLAEEAVGQLQAPDYQETTRLFQEATEYTDAYIAAAQGYESAERALLELIRYRKDESFARLQLLKK